jgi:DNA repair exonuclease SbcCD ATPase subunit
MLPHKFISLHTSLAEANSNLKRIEENYKKTQTQTNGPRYGRHARSFENASIYLLRLGCEKENAQAKRDALAQEMNTYIEQQVAEYNKDSCPSGVNPHEGVSWRDKYEYMNKLWLEEKDKNSKLYKEKQEIYNTYKELQDLHSELSKKDTQTAILQSDAILENKKIEDALVVTDKIDKDLFLDIPNIENYSIKVWLNYTIILFILPLLILIIQMLSNNSPLLMLPSP